MAKYRYTGPTGKHSHDGAPLETGALVQLTDEQARVFSDRFEATGKKRAKREEPAAQAATEPPAVAALLGDEAAAALQSAGIETVEALAAETVETLLVKVEGLDEASGESLLALAKEALSPAV